MPHVQVMRAIEHMKFPVRKPCGLLPWSPNVVTW